MTYRLATILGGASSPAELEAYLDDLAAQAFDRRLLAGLIGAPSTHPLEVRPMGYPVAELLDVRFAWQRKRPALKDAVERVEHEGIVREVRKLEKRTGVSLLMQHSDNGDPRRRRRQIQSGRGVSTGFPDLIFLRAFRLGGRSFPALALEIKRTSYRLGNLARLVPLAVQGAPEAKRKVAQLRWLSDLRAQGWVAEIARGEAEALLFLGACYRGVL